MSVQYRRGANAERAVARAVGGRRTGNRGTAAADVVGDGFVCEVKERQQLPQWQRRALEQAERAAAAFTSPVRAFVILHQHGGRYADDWILMRRGEYEVWHGSLAGYRVEGDTE